MSLVIEQRKTKIYNAVQSIRNIENCDGITHESMSKILNVLISLGLEKSLFPEEDFPLPQPNHLNKKPTRNILYLLSQDSDQRFSLYLSAENPGMVRANKPHNHTTWAVISGVIGNELNIIYDRKDDGMAPGKGKVIKSHEIIVSPGKGVALMPDGIHSLVLENEPTMTLHMYGTSMEKMTSRISFKDDGTTEIRPTNPNIVDKR